jgi:hypothetical protein
LRDKDLPAEAITVVPRSGRGAHGKVVWYSSLMLDVARLVRTGDDDTAAQAHAEATRLAGHRSSRFVAEWLVEHGGPDPDPAQLDAGTGGALTHLALLTMSARQQLQPHLLVDSIVGRVDEIADTTAAIVDSDDRRHSIPIPDVRAGKWAGAVVAVDLEVIGAGAMTVWVRPAFDADADPNERVPGGPRLLTPVERDRLARPVASAR